MNKLKITCLAAAFALTGAGVSQAQTNYIRLVGATAFRAQTISAITNLMGSTRQVFYKSGSASGSTKATEVILGGTIPGQGYTIVKAKWSGSAGGIQQVAQQIPIAFLANGNLPAAGSEAYNNSPSYDAAVAPDATFSDVEQTTTPFISPGLVAADNNPVGVVTFVWICSTNAPAGLTGITPQLAQAQWVGSGTLQASVYTGNPADTVLIKATGRDPDSGTRLTALAESGIGVNSGIYQFDVSTGNAYTQQVVNGITFTAGNGGEASGGTLAGKIATASTNNLGPYITYVSAADAKTPVAAGLVRQLAYNGVAYSTNAVKEGSYTFWSYEQLLKKNGGLAPGPNGALEAIAAAIGTLSADVPIPDMNVQRGTDGATVFHN